MNYMTLGREQRRSMTERTDTNGEFESRSPQAMRVKEVASAIEPTPNILPHLFRQSGQTEHRQAEEIKEAEMRKKVLEFEESKRDFESKMMAMKQDAAVARAEQSMLMTAMMMAALESIKAKDGPTPSLSASRSMLDDKVPIKVMSRASAVQVENSLHNFCGAIRQMGLLEIAEDDVVRSTEDEDRVYRATVHWIGDDERMPASARIHMFISHTHNHPACDVTTPLCTIKLSCSQHSNGGGHIGVDFSWIPVWVFPCLGSSLGHAFLAIAMIISHSSAAGGPPSTMSKYI